MDVARGFTFVELMIVLTIMTLLTIIAFPSVSDMLERQATTTAVNRMVVAVKIARHSAMQYRTTATLCALKADEKCGASWANELTVFLDKNQNARWEEPEEKLRVVPALTSNASIKWRAFRNRQYLQMTTFGMTNYQNGNFVVCPSSGNVRWAKQLVLNVQGRLRKNHRVNEAGYPVDRNGRLLRC